MRTLIAVHVAGNALLLWLGYYWLGLGETRAATLAWSALIALLLLALECGLQGAAFAWFSERRRLAWRCLPSLIFSAIVLLAVYAALNRWSGYSPEPAFKIASWLTLTLRKPVQPSSVLNVFNIILWLMRWMVVPALALPILASIAAGNRRPVIGPRASWWYWIATPLLLMAAFWLPLKLMGWTPYTGRFAIEMLSFVSRLLAAYLLFVAAWLALAFLTSGGRPRATQSSTVVSP